MKVPISIRKVNEPFVKGRRRVEPLSRFGIWLHGTGQVRLCGAKITEKKKISSLFVRNGVPDGYADGYVVRLVNLEEKYFPNATTINEKPDGSIVI
jgi:hypothetical protein